jgi:adenine-specific DNA-methyltransferase
MTTEPEKLDLKSMDLAAEKQAELLRLFPEIRTEGGKIDFDRLKLALGETVDVGRERYGLTWPGKADCFKTIQAPSLGTLRPEEGESVNFNTTENLIIEGDNLEVLKLLQKSYLGKVKMIYIDPPYNTGGDFIYPDNFGENLQTYLEYTGQIDDEGRKFGTNTETDGRFHSKWLNLIYPRLYLARNLLAEDGVVFISIDEIEQPNARAVCNAIFGEENFIADMVWAAGRKNDSKHVSVSHEYILAYVRNLQHLKKKEILWRQRKERLEDIYAAYDKLKAVHSNDYEAIHEGLKGWFSALPDSHAAKAHRHFSYADERGIYFPDNISWPGGGGPKYEVLHPITKKPCAIPSRGWMFSKPERMQEVINDNRVHFGSDESYVPCIKSYLKDREVDVPYSVFYQDGRAATKRLRALMGGDYFENPKDETLLQKVIEFAASPDAIILDFFAGSGTLAHAVLNMNRQDGGNRKFIICQLPEPTRTKKADGSWANSAAWEAGYKTIADFTKERVRRVIRKLNDEDGKKLDLDGNAKQDRGFRVFKLDQSNFMGWDAGASSDAEALGKQLDLSIDHVRQGRSDDDLFYELLLKSGFPLTTPVEKLRLAGKNVYSIGGGIFLICLERELTTEAIKAMADMKPSRVVCLDAGFHGNDQLKKNADLTFKAKGVAKFQTV